MLEIIFLSLQTIKHIIYIAQSLALQWENIFSQFFQCFWIMQAVNS